MTWLYQYLFYDMFFCGVLDRNVSCFYWVVWLCKFQLVGGGNITSINREVIIWFNKECAFCLELENNSTQAQCSGEVSESLSWYSISKVILNVETKLDRTDRPASFYIQLDQGWSTLYILIPSTCLGSVILNICACL